ncbi:MAG: hypothetical protein ACOCYB_10795 [Alkalispirochaeta sp.]
MHMFHRLSVGAVIAVALVCSTGCTDVMEEPPVTVGELSLSRSPLVPERYTLSVPIFNGGTSLLQRYRVSADAGVAPESDTRQVPASVELVIEEELEARSRTVHTVTFDCPLPVTPRDGLTLREITFHDFRFSPSHATGIIEYGYPVEELQ